MESCKFFTIAGEIVARHNLGGVLVGKSPFYLGSDPKQLRKDFEESGFTNVRMWYQMNNFMITDFDQYWEF